MTTVFQNLDPAVDDALARLKAINAGTWVIPQSGGKDSRVCGQLPLPGLEVAGGPGPLPFREKNRNKQLLEADND